MKTFALHTLFCGACCDLLLDKIRLLTFFSGSSPKRDFGARFGPIGFYELSFEIILIHTILSPAMLGLGHRESPEMK